MLKSIELPVDADTHGFTLASLNQFVEQEFKMIASKLYAKDITITIRQRMMFNGSFSAPKITEIINLCFN